MKLSYLISKLIQKSRLPAIRNSNIDRTARIHTASQVSRCSFGRHSYCGQNCRLDNCDIGAFTSISNNVTAGGGQHPMDWAGMSPVFYGGNGSVAAEFSNHPRTEVANVFIGNDVWIGERVLISQGVTIGDGAVIGMGSIVTKDIPAFGVAVGCPAKVMRYRFTDDVIARLLDSRWWELPDIQIKKLAPFVTDVSLFLEHLETI